MAIGMRPLSWLTQIAAVVLTIQFKFPSRDKVCEQMERFKKDLDQSKRQAEAKTTGQPQATGQPAARPAAIMHPSTVLLMLSCLLQVHASGLFDLLGDISNNLTANRPEKYAK